MADVDKKASLPSVYAPGLWRWLNESRFIRENRLLFVLGFAFALCVVGLVLMDLLVGHEDLGYRIGSEVIIAVLVATTVGVFYELVARRSMTEETVSVVRTELAPELASLREGRVSSESGLIGFGHDRKYVHQDITKHLPTAETVKVMAIHAVRLWANRDFEKAIVENSSTTLRALLLSPESAFIQVRAEEDPEVYDRSVMSGEIGSCIQKLKKWRRRNDKIDIRLYDCPASFWLIVVDNVLYVSGYDPGRVSQDSVAYKFDNRPGSMYHYFNQYFDRIWMDASEPEPSSAESP